MKRIRILFVFYMLSYGMMSCSENKQKNEIQNTDSANIKIVRNLFEYFNNHNWQQYASLYADSAKFLDPSFGKTEIVQTREQTIQKYTELQKMIPDVRDDIIAVYSAHSNMVVVEFVSQGTLPGRSSLKLPICTIFKMENGKILEDHTYFDN